MALERLIARFIAELQYNIPVQQYTAEYGRKIYFRHLIETRSYIRSILRKRAGRETLDGWLPCGSGLASLPDSPEIEIVERIPVKKIPHWFTPKAPGHGLDLVIANINGQLVGIPTGRGHFYDTNNTPEQLRMITAPLIVAKALGIKWAILTSAAGVISPHSDSDIKHEVERGDVVVLIDYVHQHGVNPLIGLNDPRLGKRFPSKGEAADPYISKLLYEIIPNGKLHGGIYTLPTNAPAYEGSGDLANSSYPELVKQNSRLVPVVGMSYPNEALVMQHFNPNPREDALGFDNPVRWLGLSIASNIIPEVAAPSLEDLIQGALRNPNPTFEEEVLEGASLAEKYLVPSIIQFCASISQNPLPPWAPS